MASGTEVQKVRLGELTGKRRLLSRQFEMNPGQTHLALELKIIDDQIAEWNREIQQDRRKQS
jgi:hypothetical protein